MGRLGDEGPADEIFETLLRHRPPSISPDTAASMQSSSYRPNRSPLGAFRQTPGKPGHESARSPKRR